MKGDRAKPQSESTLNSACDRFCAPVRGVCIKKELTHAIAPKPSKPQEPLKDVFPEVKDISDDEEAEAALQNLQAAASTPIQPADEDAAEAIPAVSSVVVPEATEDAEIAVEAKGCRVECLTRCQKESAGDDCYKTCNCTIDDEPDAAAESFPAAAVPPPSTEPMAPPTIPEQPSASDAQDPVKQVITKAGELCLVEVSKVGGDLPDTNAVDACCLSTLRKLFDGDFLPPRHVDQCVRYVHRQYVPVPVPVARRPKMPMFFTNNKGEIVYIKGVGQARPGHNLNSVMGAIIHARNGK